MEVKSSEEKRKYVDVSGRKTKPQSLIYLFQIISHFNIIQTTYFNILQNE